MLLSSIYYSSEFRRFISPDDVDYIDPESVNGLNLYCYCMNNPIMYADPSGHIAIWAAALIGGIISLAVEFVVDYFEDYSGTIDHSFLDYFGAGVGGCNFRRIWSIEKCVIAIRWRSFR